MAMLKSDNIIEQGEERSRIMITGPRAQRRYIQSDHPYLVGGYN